MASSESTRWRSISQKDCPFGKLTTPSEVLNAEYADKSTYINTYSEREWSALKRFATYAVNFLAKPNDGLGRPGNVCPFVSASLSKGLLWLTSTLANEAFEVESAMEVMRDVFANMEPISGADAILKSIVVVFPNVSAEAAGGMIGGLQKRLKPAYVKSGFMIGEFYPGCAEPGLHNKNFRPLHSPVAALAIRHITKYDAPFMIEDVAFMAAYLERFGEDGLRQLQGAAKPGSNEHCPMHNRTMK
jgi:hypothetical protein